MTLKEKEGLALDQIEPKGKEFNTTKIYLLEVSHQTVLLAKRLSMHMLFL